MDLENDFEMFKDDALGITIVRSCNRQESVKISGIDTCTVRPVSDEVLTKVNRMLGGKYDIKIFENLPPYIPIEMIRDHMILHGIAR